MTQKNPAAVALPCGHTLSEAELLRLAGQITGKRRVGKPSGRNGGRPKSLDRCLCGAMTAKIAAQRGHVCIYLLDEYDACR